MAEVGLSLVLIFFLDQWSKSLVVARLGGTAIRATRFVTIRRVTSAQARYNSQLARTVMVLCWVGAAIAVAVFHGMGERFQSRMSLAGCGAALGGAAGNLFDVLRNRSVVDFIDLGWWPVFNVADVAIVVGLAAALAFG